MLSAHHINVAETPGNLSIPRLNQKMVMIGQGIKTCYPPFPLQPGWLHTMLSLALSVGFKKQHPHHPLRPKLQGSDSFPAGPPQTRKRA